jgi:hypothetical protein
MEHDAPFKSEGGSTKLPVTGGALGEAVMLRCYIGHRRRPAQSDTSTRQGAVLVSIWKTAGELEA